MINAIFLDSSTVFVRLYFSALFIEHAFPKVKLESIQVFAIYLLIKFISNINKSDSVSGHIAFELINLFVFSVVAIITFWIFKS